MSKREPQADSGEPDAMLPIPDGGLGSGMPEWLRRPPAWRSAAATPAPPKNIPPPDISPIDPRTILTIDDLPAWLQGIATSTSSGTAGGVDVDTEDVSSSVTPEPPPIVPTPEPETVVVAPPSAPTPSAASVSTASHDVPVWFRIAPRPAPAMRSWPPITPTLVLSTALLIALVIILLLATSVF